MLPARSFSGIVKCMEILSWILIVPLLCIWLICTVFNWGVIIQVLRNKFTGGTERVPSMIPLVGGICLILVSIFFSGWLKQLSLPIWLGVTILLLDPGSIPYLLFVVIGLPFISIWRGLANLFNKARHTSE